jgi:hypothetical protein
MPTAEFLSGKSDRMQQTTGVAGSLTPIVDQCAVVANSFANPNADLWHDLWHQLSLWADRALHGYLRRPRYHSDAENWNLDHDHDQ